MAGRARRGRDARRSSKIIGRSDSQFRVLRKDEMENKADCGMSYETTVLTPIAFCQWLKAKCEAKGVRFVRRDVTSLAEASAVAPAQVVVNASGVGSRFLHDVKDSTCHSVRGQTLVVRCKADRIWAHHGKAYTYIIPRGDGTAILGGIKEVDAVEPHVNEEIQRDVSVFCPRLAWRLAHLFLTIRYVGRRPRIVPPSPLP